MILDVLKSSWAAIGPQAKKVVAVGLVAILALVGAFLAGRHSVPVKTVDTKTDQKIDTSKLFTQSQVDLAVNQAVQKYVQEHVHTVIKDVKKKDGTEIKTTTYDRDTDTHTEEQKQEKKEEKQVQVVEHTITEIKTETKTIQAAKPQWHGSLQIGTNLGLVHIQPNAPYINPLIFGGQVEHRIIGPVFFGIWGRSDKSAGITVGGEW